MQLFQPGEELPIPIEGLDFVVGEDWPVVMTRDFRIPLTRDFGASYHLLKGGNTLAVLEHHSLTLKAGYACDGYSPVVKRPWWIPGRDPWIRFTRMPKCGLAPALGHDPLRQFLDVSVYDADGMAHEPCPWDREYTDDEFFNWMALGGIGRHEAGLYHRGVAGPLGTAYIWFTRKPDKSLSIIRHEYRS